MYLHTQHKPLNYWDKTMYLHTQHKPLNYLDKTYIYCAAKFQNLLMDFKVKPKYLPQEVNLFLLTLY